MKKLQCTLRFLLALCLTLSLSASALASTFTDAHGNEIELDDSLEAYANGDTQEFTDAEAFLKFVREELPYHPTTGFRYEVLTDDPTVRKQVDDIVFDLYGEENPRQLEEYQKTPKQGMTMGGIR